MFYIEEIEIFNYSEPLKRKKYSVSSMEFAVIKMLVFCDKRRGRKISSFKVFDDKNNIVLEREYPPVKGWIWVSQHKNLSEDLIREFQNRFLWRYISNHQKLSENFIRGFQNRVSWRDISLTQKLSEEFIKEFENRLYKGCLLTNENISIITQSKIRRNGL